MLNMDEDRVTIAATHTHAGPGLEHDLNRYFAKISAGTAYIAGRKAEEVQLYSGSGSVTALP